MFIVIINRILYLLSHSACTVYIRDVISSNTSTVKELDNVGQNWAKAISTFRKKSILPITTHRLSNWTLLNIQRVLIVRQHEFVDEC